MIKMNIKNRLTSSFLFMILMNFSLGFITLIYLNKLNYQLTNIVEEGASLMALELVKEADIIILSFIIFSIGVGGSLAFFIPPRIVNTIHALSKFTIAFGKGNLTARTRFKPTDEIGLMAENLDQAIEKFHNIVSKVSESSQIVEHNLGVLLSSVEENSSKAESQKSYTEKVVDQMTQMSMAIKDITHNSSKVVRAAAETDEQAKQSSSVAQQALYDINNLADEII